ncbi:hypothetical protein D3C81_2119100 [compost metagenome]
MEKGTFKVFKNLSGWFDEKLNYHRDEDGHIVKVQDDLLSATRYAYMMRRFAIQKISLTPKPAEPAENPYHHLPMGSQSWMN